MSYISYPLFSIVDLVTCCFAVAKLLFLRISFSEINPVYRIITYLLILLFANVAINILTNQMYPAGWLSLIVSVSVFLVCGFIHDYLRRKKTEDK